MRGDKLAGISSAAAVLNTTKGKAPLPVMQIAGKSDPLVFFQKSATKHGKDLQFKRMCFF